MRLLRRITLGGLLAAFVYFPFACAKAVDDAGGGFVDDGGADATSDAKLRKDASATDDDDDDAGGAGEKDSGPSCVGKVLVNELQTAGTTANDEFVEIYNPQSCAIALNGWKLSYRASSDNAGLTMYSFPAGAQIPAKSFLILGSSVFAGKKDATLTGTSMAAGAGQVALLDGAGKIVDGVAYGKLDAGTYLEESPAPAPAANASIGRKKDGVDTDDNGADFEAFATPTPGASNE